eukprot:XP_016664399.1 PREDICTED: zinc finger protein aebp2-like [Acyrthosiphon pisum]
MKNHRLSHTSERSYPCDLCNQSFAHSGSLTKHRKTHVEDNTCGKLMNHRPLDADNTQSGSLTRRQQTLVDDNQSCKLINQRPTDADDTKSSSLINFQPADAVDTQIDNRIMKHREIETVHQETIVFKKSVMQRHGSIRNVKSESRMLISVALTSTCRTSMIL